MKIIETIQIACGQTYLMQTMDGAYIEAGDVFMALEKGIGTRPYHFSDFEDPDDRNKRVMTVSTMAGCPCACLFCASRKSFKRNLSAYEIVLQVQMMVDAGKQYGRDADPNNAKEFRVLCTRMGEPMLNAENVIEAIRRLRIMYPHIIIGMSTSGYKQGLDMLLSNPVLLPYIDMQFSLHSTNQLERDYLFDTTSNLSIPEIAQYTEKWYEASGRKASLNVILFEGFSYDFESLLEWFDPAKVWIRLSPWNPVDESKSKFRSLLQTADVIQKKPISGVHLGSIMNNLDAARFSYSYAPAIDEEIKHDVACGQALQAFKKTQVR